MAVLSLYSKKISFVIIFFGMLFVFLLVEKGTVKYLHFN